MTLLKKELRQTIFTWPVAAVVMALMCYAGAPERSAYPSGFSNSAAISGSIAGAVYALVLAVVQFAPERRTEVRGWLFGTPLSRSVVFWNKTLAAWLLHTGAVAVVSIGYYLYLRRYLPAYAPVSPASMLLATIGFMALFIFHPATAWMIHRDAAWFGTRTFVLVPAGVVFVCVVALLRTTGGSPFAWFFAVAVGVTVVSVLYVLTIRSARQTYVRGSDMPTLTDTPDTTGRATARLGNAAALWMTGTAAIAVIGAMISSSLTTYDGFERSIVFTADGKPADVEFRWRYDTGGAARREIRSATILSPIDGDEVVSGERPLSPEAFDGLIEPNFFFEGSDAASFHPLTRIGTVTTNSPRHRWFVHRDGYVMAYSSMSVDDDEPTLRRTIGRKDAEAGRPPVTGRTSAIHDTTLASAERMLNLPPLFQDSRTLFEIDDVKPTVRSLIEGVQASALLHAERIGDDGQVTIHPMLVTRRNEQLHFADVMPADGSPLPTFDGDTKLQQTATIDRIAVRTRAVAELPADWAEGFPVDDRFMTAAWLPGGDRMVMLQSHGKTRRYRTWRIVDDGRIVADRTYLRPPVPTPWWQTVLTNVAIPPLLLPILGAFATIVFGPNPLVLLIMAAAHAALGGWATGWAARYRRLGPKASHRWRIAGACFGLPTAAALLGTYEHPAVEPCPGCETPRRVDLDQECHQCGQPWGRPPASPIDVFASAAGA